MAETVNNTVADIQEAFSNLGTTTCIRLMNQVHVRLIEEFKLQTTTVDFSSFDGTAREYTWAEAHVSVWSADWISASGATPIPIDQTSYEELDAMSAGWRNSTVALPSEFYLWQNSSGAAVVGFDTIPTASTGGYPLARFVVSVYSALSAGGSLPATLKNNLPYVSGVCAIWAARRGTPTQAAFWEMQHLKDLGELAMYVARRQRHNDSQVTPAFGGVAAY